MKSSRDNDKTDTLRKEKSNFDLQMYMHIANSIKEKELDDDDALGQYSGYRNLMKHGRKMAFISAIILLLSVTIVAIPLYLDANSMGSGALSWISGLPEVAAIPVGVLWIALLFYCFIKTINALLCWSIVRHIRKYYFHLFENALEP